MEKSELLPIDYQEGDVVYPKNDPTMQRAVVVAITETGIYLKMLIGDGKQFRVAHHEANLLTKDKVGTLLHGRKDT